MIIIEGTQEMADRWAVHLKYVASLRGAVGWDKVSNTSPEKVKEVIRLYNVCGSKGKVSRDLRMSRLTVGKILDAQGVPA